RPPPHRSPEPADIRNSAIAPIGTTFSTPVKAVPPGVTVVGATSSVDDVGGTGVGATLALVVVSVAVVMSVTVVVVRSVTVGVVVTVDVASHSCWRTSPGAAVTPLGGGGPTVTVAVVAAVTVSVTVSVTVAVVVAGTVVVVVEVPSGHVGGGEVVSVVVSVGVVV